MYAGVAQDGNNAHHLRPSNSLAQPPLRFRGKAGVFPPFYPPHLSDKVGQQHVVRAFSHGVKAQLVEHVGVTGNMSWGADEWSFSI